MIEIIGVRFKSGGKTYYFQPNGMEIALGDHVIVETTRGIEYGECTQGNTMVDEMTVTEPLRPVLRMATEEDRNMRESNRKKEAWALELCQKKIEEHKLDMKLVNVEYNFDGSKILFFFTSDGRVDFRELVKDLASVFRTRIELRQIGVRDEAKMLGGLGICGQPFCCSRFLSEFQPVSIKMAKTQNLSLNPTKISGTCGRLMCCLKYEQDAYEDLLKRAPKQDSFVETPDGVGTVSSISLLREQAKVRLDIVPETPRTYPCSEIKVIRSGKGKRPEGYDSQEEIQAAYVRKTMEEARKQQSEEAAAREAEIRNARRGRGDTGQARPNNGRPGGRPHGKTGPGKDKGKEAPERKTARPPQPPQEGAAPKTKQQAQPPKGDAPSGQKRRPRNNFHRGKGRPQQKGKGQAQPPAPPAGQ